MIEKTTCLDYGMVLFRIMNKIFNKLEEKIKLIKDTNFKISKSLNNFNNKNLEIQKFKILYPPIEQESSQLHSKSKTFSQADRSIAPSISIRDFYLLSLEALILSCYEFEKVPLNLNLIENAHDMLKKIVFDNDQNEDWKTIFSIIIYKLHALIICFHEKQPLNYFLMKIKNFFFKLFSNFNVSALKELLESYPQLLDNLKDIIFISQNNQSTKILFDKLEELKLSHVLCDKINLIMNDYENSEIIRKSLSICGRFSEKYIKLDSNSKEDIAFIISNFSNILIASEYNDQTELPLIKILCDLWEISRENKTSNCLDEISEIFIKILSVPNDKKKIKIYSSLLQEISFRPANLISLLIYREEIFLLFLNDVNLISDSSSDNYCLDFIFEVIQTLINKNPKSKIVNQVARLIPNIPTNFKYTSINLKLDSYNFKEKFIRYIQNLYSKDDQVRLNALSYLKINYSKINSKFMEFYDLSFNEIKKLDPIIAIQSAQNGI
jgi:hypothetical protein